MSRKPSAHALEIWHVILTHLHADFLVGHLELRDQAGVAIYLGAQAKAEYTFTPLKNGRHDRARPRGSEKPAKRRDTRPSRFRSWCTRIAMLRRRGPSSPGMRSLSATWGVPICARPWAGLRRTWEKCSIDNRIQTF